MSFILTVLSCICQPAQEGPEERARRVRPPDTRVTVDLRGVKPLDAAKQSLSLFGINPDWVVGRGAAEKMDLKLNNADFWQTLDSYCDHAGLGRITTPWHPAVMVGMICGTGLSEIAFRHIDAGNARVVLAIHPKDHGGGSHPWIEVLPMLPPGSRPSALWFERLTLRDRKESEIPLGDPYREMAFRIPGESPWTIRVPERSPGRITWGRGGHVYSESGRADGPLTLEGTLAISYPRDLEIRRIPMKDASVRQAVDFEGSRIMIHLTRRVGEYPGCEVSTEWDSSPIRRHYLIWQEDKDGAWVSDVAFLTQEDRPSSAQCSNVGKSDASVLCIARYIGDVPVRIPFKIEGIQFPVEEADKAPLSLIPWACGVTLILLILVATVLFVRKREFKTPRL